MQAQVSDIYGYTVFANIDKRNGKKVKSIFYGEEEFDKTMKLAQQMEEFIEAGNTVD